MSDGYTVPKILGNGNVHFTIIDAKEAPSRPRSAQTSRRTNLVNDLVNSLAPGKVAKVQLENGETPRGAKTSITRAAKKLGLNVSLWDADGVVYAQLIDDSGRRTGNS